MKVTGVILLWHFILFYGSDGLALEPNGTAEIIQNLPNTFFNVGWSKIGIVTKSPKNFISLFKSQALTDIGSTFCVRSSLRDFKNEFNSYDGFFIGDDLSTENLKEMSSLLKYGKPYNYLILEDSPKNEMTKTFQEALTR